MRSPGDVSHHTRQQKGKWAKRMALEPDKVTKLTYLGESSLLLISYFAADRGNRHAQLPAQATARRSQFIQKL